MDLANRLIIVLLSLLLMFVVAVVILFTWAAAPDSVQRLRDFVQFLDDHDANNGARVILTLGGVVVALLALVVIIGELTPARAERVPVRDVKAGDALLSTDAIAQRLQQEVSTVPHVTQTKAVVAARGKGVEVDLELHVDPETNLALTSEEACRAVENLLNSRLNVEMARPPRLNLRYSELRLAGATAKAPFGSPLPAEEAGEAGAEAVELEPAPVAAASAAADDTPTDEELATAGEAPVAPAEAQGEEAQGQKDT